MNILMNVLADKRTQLGTDYGGIPFDEVEIEIKQGTNIVLQGIMSDIFDSMMTQIYRMIDSNGIEINVGADNHRYDVVSKIGTAKLKLELRRITDSVTFTIKLTHADYFIYSNTFTVFGYDMGNNINFGTPDGKFTGILDGDAIALANNAYNPIFAIDNNADTPIYGQEPDDNTIIRHNSDFNIGMIPKTITDEVSGNPVPQDLRYGTSGRFIVTKNPVDERTIVVNANSNEPSSPQYVITYGYKRLTDPTYTHTNFAEFAHVMDVVDWDIIKMFSIGVGTPVTQSRVHVRHLNIIPDTIKKVNGVDITSFTGALNGAINASIDIDEHSVFYFWSNWAKGLSAITAAVLYYTLDKVIAGPSYQQLDAQQSLAMFHSSDTPTTTTIQVPYNEHAHNKILSASINTLCRIGIRIMWLGLEDSQYIKRGSDVIDSGTKYMIGSNGIALAEDYAPIGYGGSIYTSRFKTFVAINTAGYSFNADGVLHTLAISLGTVPLRLYAPDTQGVYNINLDTSYVTDLTWGANIDGYMRLLPIDESYEELTVPYADYYSLISSGCGSVTLTIYPDASPPSPTVHVLIEVWDDETSTYILYNEEDINIDPSNEVISIVDLPDGIYKLTIDGRQYTFFSTCSIVNCYIDVIKNSVCGCCEHDDCRAKAYYRFNEFMLLWNTYLSMISVNNDDFNFIDSNLIDFETLLDYIEISKIQARIKDLCDDCNSITKKCKTC